MKYDFRDLREDLLLEKYGDIIEEAAENSFDGELTSSDIRHEIRHPDTGDLVDHDSVETLLDSYVEMLDGIELVAERLGQNVYSLDPDMLSESIEEFRSEKDEESSDDENRYGSEVDLTETEKEKVKERRNEAGEEGDDYGENLEITEEGAQGLEQLFDSTS